MKISANKQYPGLSEARVIVSNETVSTGLRAEGIFSMVLLLWKMKDERNSSICIGGGVGVGCVSSTILTILVKVSKLSETPTSELAVAIWFSRETEARVGMEELSQSLRFRPFVQRGRTHLALQEDLGPTRRCSSWRRRCASWLTSGMQSISTGTLNTSQRLWMKYMETFGTQKTLPTSTGLTSRSTDPTWCLHPPHARKVVKKSSLLTFLQF